MANSLLKWCKTKILSGYKQINVEGNDEMCSGNRSDTEFLVRSSDEEILLTPTGRNYPCGPGNIETAEISYSVTSSPKYSIERRKRVAGGRASQGVSCDVNVSEDGCERQEFAFTLYDFHGQGRVTKDDIASLVQSIYETVGSSMSLPPSGSRTVKVKLSVAPTEGRNHHKYDSKGHRISNWSYSTPRESPRTIYNESCSSLGESPRYYDEWNNSYKSSPNVTPREKDSPRVGDSLLSPRQSDFAEPLSPRQEYGNSPRQLIEAEEETEVGVTPRKTKRRRKVHYQRQELLQMIQANMEKNNLYYPPLRNNHSCVHSHHGNHHRRRRKRSLHHQHNTCCGCCCKCTCGGNTQQQKSHGSNGSLDPATLKARLMNFDDSVNTSSSNNNNSDVTLNLDTTCNSNSISCDQHSTPSKNYHHHRSRSQDLNTDSPHVFRHYLLDGSSQQQHPLPPSNTPDRPISPYVNHHHHHSHNHHHNLQSSYRHRSRSCEGDEKPKDRLSLSYQIPVQGLYHYHLGKKKNIDSVIRHYSPFTKVNSDHHCGDDEVVNWLGKNSAKNVETLGIIKNISESLPRKTVLKIDDNGNSSTDSSKKCDVEDLIVATKNFGVDDNSPSSSNGCGRSHHVHQHYHHHYHHYPSTPLII